MSLKEKLCPVLHKAVLSEEEIKIALYGRPPEEGRFAQVLEAGNPRFSPLARLTNLEGKRPSLALW
ncbi:MAG: hypothetical protein AB1566_08660 [Chloroflexota bacterium]